MKPQDLDLNTKIDLLKFIYQDQRSEVEYRREREHKIFTLHCFEKGYYDPSGGALFPDNWSSYGRNKITFRRRLFAANYASATFLLGILALIMIWVS